MYAVRLSASHVVGLAALDMAQPRAELDVAGVGLALADLLAVNLPYVLMLDLMYTLCSAVPGC